jgi:3',5'-cyclic AMP phosphodiesterase CpdA
VCDQKGCDFGLLLGDNFYDTGVSAVDDQQFIDKFELPYADLQMPFYVVMGNHDYGEISNEWEKGQFQIDYTQNSDRWRAPAFWYDFRPEAWPATHFIAFDTARLMWDKDTDAQKAFLESVISQSDGLWKVVFAHHPYISNGDHGNAGNYEGLSFVPLVNGSVVKEVFDEKLCDKVDVYFSGHDHNRQSHPARCGVALIVSGAGAKTDGFVNRDDNEELWADDTKPGFMWVEISGDTFTGEWYDLDGNLDYTHTFTKPLAKKTPVLRDGAR